ncbi:MAG: PAS domain-containing protein, partial [Anaerolineae bacterium]|nr:PAS domain-containing protein [Anaerolineae bacterium]
MSIPKKRTPALPALLSILFLVIYLAWLIWAAPRSPQGALTGTWTLVFTGLAALGLAWEVRSGLSARADRRAWSVLCAALLLLTLADGFRAFPSLAWLPDLITLAGYTALLTSLLLYPRRARSTQGRFRPLAEAFISAAAALTLAWMILFQPLFRNAVFNVTTLLPALDMFILLALLVLYLTSQPGGSSGLFGWLAAALTALTISDLSYAILLPQGGYSPVSLVNLGWVLGDLLLIAAISSRWGRPTLLDPPSPAGLVSRATERAQLLMPLVLTAALGWYTVIDMQLRGRADPIGLWASVLLSLALIARQGLLAGEYEFQRYARLADSIAEPTFICDRRGRVQWANPALIKIAGLARAEDLVRLPLEQLFRPSQEMQRILAAGQAGGWSGEMHLQRSDGQRVPVMLSLRPLPWSGRDKLALAGTAHDLSEIKRQQTALQQAYEDITAAHLQLEKLNSQLEQRVLEKTADLSEAYAQLERQNLALRNLDRLKSDFVSLVSHELRAPLTNIN